MSLAHLRQEYKRGELSETNVDSNPFKQFQGWFDEALKAGLLEPNAMTLATATSEGIPSARIVLLKNFDERGFVFFSHFTSRKGRELAVNPHAALLFFWAELERQVRIEGTVELVNDAESDEYFQSRPLSSRLGAAVSPQSEVIASREVLDQRLEALKSQFGENVPRPETWGGTRIVPTVFEFWHGRTSRLHDRIRYTKRDHEWRIERLGP